MASFTVLQLDRRKLNVSILLSNAASSSTLGSRVRRESPRAFFCNERFRGSSLVAVFFDECVHSSFITPTITSASMSLSHASSFMFGLLPGSSESRKLVLNKESGAVIDKLQRNRVLTALDVRST